MSKRSTTKDVDALLRAAKKAGFDIDRKGTRHKVTNPLTGDYCLINQAPSGVHGLENQKHGLAEVGFTPGMSRLRPPALAPALAPPAPIPAPAEPPAEHRPTEHTTKETPMTATTDIAPFPAGRPALIEGISGELPAFAGVPALGDLPTNAWLLWKAIHDYGNSLKAHDRNGVNGVLWSGVFGKVIAAMWPDLPAKGTGPQQAIGKWLNASGNMVCLQPHTRPPLWWLSASWVDATPNTDLVVTAEQVSEALVAVALADEDAAPPLEVPAAPEVLVVPRLADDADLEVLARVLQDARKLKERNLELEHANEALQRAHDQAQERLAHFRKAIQGLDLSA